MQKRNSKSLTAFILSLSLLLGSLGMPGVTAVYADVAPQETETVVKEPEIKITTSAALSLSSISYGGGSVSASGAVTSNVDIVNRGFVYSYNGTPTLADGSGSISAGSGTGAFSASFPVSGDNAYCYVRAFAVDIDGTVWYSSSASVSIPVAPEEVNTDPPQVSTVSVSDVDYNEADVEIQVTSEGGSGITSRGVVYSRTYSVPTLDNASSKSISGTTGYGIAYLTGLSRGTKYYVRAYAANSFGTSYGEVRAFYTDDDGYYYYEDDDEILETTTVKNITKNSADLYGYVYGTYNYSVREVGFVYSSEIKTPYLGKDDCYKVYDSTHSLGSFSETLTGLDSNTTYYVRAYVKTSNNTYYGDSARFTTRSSSDTQKETEKEGYMPVAGDGYFYPDETITRGDLAQALYNLSDKDSDAYLSFIDIYGDREYVKAISYAVSEDYMSDYADGSFRPDGYVTRAELAAILCSYYELSGSGLADYSDVNGGHWASRYIALAAQAGYLDGMVEDNKFLPNENVTRAEACHVFYLAEERTGDYECEDSFYDVPAGYWAYEYIMNAAIE